MKKTFFSNGSAFLFRKTRGLVASALSAAALLSALSLAAPLHAADAPADQKAIAAKMNRKGFELFRHLSEGDTKENAFISPYSINSAFGLVYCGAKEKTAQEIRDTLGLPDDPAACGEFFHAVSQEYAANKLVEVLVSNSVWYEQKYEKAILPSFFAMIDKYYDGTFYKEDFKKPGPLVAKVNAYVEDHTKNMIKDLLSTSDISEKTFMILLNTLYFEAKWRTPFKKDETKPMIFRNFDGKDKRVKMMYRRGFDIGYYSSEADNVHAVVLPYEDSRFELVALMPIQSGADQGESAMKNIISKIGDKLDDWLKNRSPYETRLWLPITDLTSRYDLKKALKELGMPTPFNVTQANFHGIAEPPKDRPATDEDLIYIWIEKVIHKTALKMDEETTKAAAATAVIMGGLGGGINTQPPPVNIFRADRPFLVLIRDNKTGLILFAGRINDPGVEATEADGPVTPSFGLPGMPFPGFGMPPFQQRPNGGVGPAEGPARTTVPGTTGPGTRPATQTFPQRMTTAAKPDATAEKGEPAAGKVDGQISVILEAMIDGKDAFVFQDGKVSLEHKSFKAPVDITVNGKPWTDLTKPFNLGFTPAPAATKFVCEGRGQKSMTRTDDSVTVTIYDPQGAASRYRIILFQPSGVENPLESPKDPVDETEVEISSGNTLAPLTQTAIPRTDESAASKADGNQKDQNNDTGVALWNTEQDGQPEVQLRKLISDMAKHAEVYLRALGSVRTSSIDVEHAYADVDLTIVDEYSKIIHFIDEIEKQTPRLSWRRLEIRIEPARALARQQADTVPADDVRKFRMVAQIRAVTYTPAQEESVPAAEAATSAKSEQIIPGGTDYLTVLYDLSLALPADALVTSFRLNDGRCDFQLQTHDESTDPARYLTTPYWQISRIQKRLISDDLFIYSISLVEKENPPQPNQDGVTRENKVAAIVALNIFDPDRTSKKTVNNDRPAGQTATSAEPGVMVLEGTFEGRGSFHFIDGLVVYSHKEGTYPTGVKINGQSWVNLRNPVKLPGEAFPVRIIRKQARGTVTLLPADDFARLEIDDHQDGSASYRIELGTK